MKRILNLVFFLTICFSILSCSTNYYTVLLSEDATVYSSADSTNIVTIIPKNTQVFLSSKPNKGNYKKIKWNNYSGWAHNPVYTSYNNYIPVKTPSRTSTYNYSSENTRSSGGSVSVKGYYRKNGTYVKPHTRSSPSRRR
ncbi:hypothetical protein [Chryseobacterium sp. SIMBA_028]|uniref:hypothetical protein n=1 Tax=Chryseobacterium sp. SIMBA_028 TaxID=3085771 RepID=UPI003978FCD2